MNAGESAAEQARKQREKAERLLRSADMWEKGAEGEQAVAEALRGLGDGWVVLHDVRWPGRTLANIDHIAIGPGGIFVIDAKNWSGAITVRDEVLRQNGYRREGAVAGCADSAIAVGDLLTGQMANVKPVLCFVGEVTIEGSARDVALRTTSNLAEMLLGSPEVLTPDEVREIGVRLRLGTQAPTPRPTPPHAPRSKARQIRPARARQVRSSTRTARTARRRRAARKEAISGVIAIVLGLVLLNVVTKGHHATSPGAGKSGIVSTVHHTGAVTYRVTSTVGHRARAISWRQGSITHTVPVPRLPFVHTFPLPHGHRPIYSVNVSYGGSGTVTCQITVDGVVVATESSKGPYGFVNCVS
jgi:hypothetical protein